MVKEFSKSLLSEEIKKNSVIVLDFYAIWCGPCRTFSQVFELVSEELKDVAIFGKINIDEQRDLAVQYKVSSIPNIIIIKNGDLIWTHIGMIEEAALQAKIKSIIK